MEKPEPKNCPRCGTAFTCLVEDIDNCPCHVLVLSEPAKVFLKSSYLDCLCTECLIHINQQTQEALLHSFPTEKEMLVEGLHYYKDGELWVFTEFYHLLRGYCCQNACRHCAYGFKK